MLVMVSTNAVLLAALPKVLEETNRDPAHFKGYSMISQKNDAHLTRASNQIQGITRAPIVRRGPQQGHHPLVMSVVY